MRISDWSSDVCSSDLTDRCDLRPKDGSRRSHASLCVTSAFASYPRQLSVPFGRHHEEDHILLDNDRLNLVIASVGGDSGAAIRGGIQNGNGERAEARRGGKEGVGTWRSRWWPYGKKKKRKTTKTKQKN